MNMRLLRRDCKVFKSCCLPTDTEVVVVVGHEAQAACGSALLGVLGVRTPADSASLTHAAVSRPDNNEKISVAQPVQASIICIVTSAPTTELLAETNNPYP